LPAVAEVVGVLVIASGGVGTPQDTNRGQGGRGLAASIFHHGEYTIAERKQYPAEPRACVRR